MNVSLGGWKMLFIPRDGPLNAVDDMRRFLQTVPFAGIQDHFGFHSHLLQGNVVFLYLGDGSRRIVRAGKVVVAGVFSA